MENIDHIAAALTVNQRAEIRHADVDWKRPADAGTARRIWFGIRPLGGAWGNVGETYHPLQRQHRACLYRLSEFGISLKAAILRAERQA